MRSVFPVAILELDVLADELRRIAVGDGNRSFGVLDRVPASLVPAVGDVDQHADVVHLLDHVAAVELRDAVVLILPATGGDKILDVVRELDDADAQGVVDLDEIDFVLQRGGVLEAENHRGATGSADGLDVLAGARERDQVKVVVEQPVPLANDAQRLSRVLPDRKGDVHAVETGLAPQLESLPVVYAPRQAVDEQQVVYVLPPSRRQTCPRRPA